MNDYEGPLCALTIEQLDDDCLECIFMRLEDIFDQLQIARVCERFDAIVARIWRRQIRHQTLNLAVWREWLPNDEDLSYFLNTMRDNLTAVVVESQPLSQFLVDIQRLLSVRTGACRLTNVRYFEDEEVSSLADEDIKALALLLPNVKSLFLKEPLSGRYIINFEQLKELHLYAPTDKEFELDNAQLIEICQRLKQLCVLDLRNFYGKSRLCLEPVLCCENLVVLKVNLNALKPHLNSVLQMTKLKQLSVLLDQEFDVSRIENIDTFDFKIYETEEFYTILKTQSERIVGLAADLYYLPLRSAWPSDLALYDDGRKLKTLALCSGTFCAETLQEYARNMGSLETLSCRYWEHLSNIHVLQIVERCPRLIHLDVSYCANITEKLLYELLEVWKRQERRRPLHIHYFLSGLENEVERVNPKFWSSQFLIKPVADFPPNSERGLSYVHRGYEFYFE